MKSSHRVLERAVVLEYAVQRANELDQRLLIVFSLTDGYPDPTSTTTPVCSSASKDVEEELRRRVIKFVVRERSPDEVALEAGEMASLTVTDRGYMRAPRSDDAPAWSSQPAVSLRKSSPTSCCRSSWPRLSGRRWRDKKDGRKHLYIREQLENAETHDPYWNAAIKETVHTGYMHSRMRMHWERRSWSGLTHLSTPTGPALPQQQVLPRQPRPQLLRQRPLGLGPARPGLDRAGGLRQGPLHVRWKP
jgi:hypothetical protein